MTHNDFESSPPDSPDSPNDDSHDDSTVQSPVQSQFSVVADRLISRRRFLGDSAVLGASAFVAGAVASTPRTALAAGPLSFTAIAANTADTVTVPPGFGWHVVASWGDPLWSAGSQFDERTRGTAATQALSVGDNNDGMWLFTRADKSVIAVNNEYVNVGHIFGNREGGRPRTVDDVNKGKAGHGVTVMEVRQRRGKWQIVKDSQFNRRITPDTPMRLTGPAAGHSMLKTAADPSGTQSLGTWNNCGNGKTPWGTYLACEENFNGYYSSSDEAHQPTQHMARYGVSNRSRGYAWAAVDARFDISKHPNESNRNGYVVEIDPFDPQSTPKKRTALGRLKHENAELVVSKSGRVVVYMGDDATGEYLYKFVSAGTFQEGGDNLELLAEGNLFAARFADDGQGEWLALTPQATGLKSKAEVCFMTRQAASAVKATTMDRPEWVAAAPTRAEVYCALTNNKNRGKKSNAGGEPMDVNGPNPRARNRYGQIVRLRPTADNHDAMDFEWDLFAIAGNPVVHSDANAGSPNITPDNMFNSPDGLSFDSQGGLWIQTDGNYSNAEGYAGQGNNQMLLGNPSTGEIKRFLVGPRECEITGLTFSADAKTMFVGIQHPGQRGGSHFPGGGDSVPRSSIVAINRDDGGVMG
jgi:uncharacterized protein